jgi:hypothetical protein
MKSTGLDWLDTLSPERREEVNRLAAEAGRQSDEHMQRVCTSFGYRHGYYWTMITYIMLTLFASFLGVLAFGLFAPTQDMAFDAKIGIMSVILCSSCLIIPVLFFVFLKPRYAFRALGVLILVVAIWQLLFSIFDPMFNMAINALLEAQR